MTFSAQGTHKSHDSMRQYAEKSTEQLRTTAATGISVYDAGYQSPSKNGLRIHEIPVKRMYMLIDLNHMFIQYQAVFIKP
jgi:hypothetical protein